MLDSAIKYSIVICTYNRANMLSATLQRLSLVDYPRDRFEILVIDNNSTDHTQEAVEAISNSSDCNVRYVRETKQGLAPARNRALSEFKGEYLLFTDDDVLVCSGWITAIDETFTNSGALCVGGRVFLQWDFPKPEWIDPRLEYLLSCVDFGEEDVEIFPPHAAVGANVGFHRSVFEKYGQFNEDLGPRKEDFIRGEETEFIHRIQAGGDKVFYSAKAVVYHIVLPEGGEKAWFLKRFSKAGEVHGKFFQSSNLGRVMKLRAKILAGRLLLLCGRILKKERMEFYAQCKCASFGAELREVVARRLHGKH